MATPWSPGTGASAGGGAETLLPRAATASAGTTRPGAAAHPPPLLPSANPSPVLPLAARSVYEYMGNEANARPAKCVPGERARGAAYKAAARAVALPPSRWRLARGHTYGGRLEGAAGRQA